MAHAVGIDEFPQELDELHPLLGIEAVESKPAGCVYFAADRAPTDTKCVVLDGTGQGPVLNVAVMSNVAFPPLPFTVPTLHKLPT